MTTPSTDPVPTTPAKPASMWEDFIDILYAPSTVYERRQDANPWPMILVMTVLLTLVTVLTWNSIAPLVDAEAHAAAAKTMAANPQMTADQAEMGIKIQMGVRRWIGVLFPIGALVGGLLVWLLAKILGTKETYTKALIVVAYSSVISLVGAIVIGAEALVLDLSSMTSPDQLSISAARFVDKASISPWVYGFLKVVDVFAIWSLIVTAIGVRVTGKTTKEKAILFGVIWFVVTALMAGWGAHRAAGG